MSAEPPRYEGFAPGRHAIEAYGAGGFRFAGMGHVGSILASPSGVRAIDAATLGDVARETLTPLFADLAEMPGCVEFLVIGAGEKMALPPRQLATMLREAGLRFETMATGPAARLYNIMLGEDRRVAALLLAAP